MWMTETTTVDADGFHCYRTPRTERQGCTLCRPYCLISDLAWLSNVARTWFRAETPNT